MTHYFFWETSPVLPSMFTCSNIVVWLKAAPVHHLQGGGGAGLRRRLQRVVLHRLPRGKGALKKKRIRSISGNVC